MSTDIQLVTTALADFDRVGAGLAELTKSYGGVVFSVQTAAGMEAARMARVAVREPRYEIERIRKSAKAPLLAIGKRLDTEAARITTELLRIEEPIDQQIKAEEGRKEREKAAAAAAEAARVAGIQARIEALRKIPINAALKSATQIVALIAEIESVEIDSGYAEFADIALQARQPAVFALRGLHAQAIEAEAEKARLAAERAELDRLRAEQEERIAAELREQKARAKVEADRLAAERREQDARAKAEADRLSAERASVERQQAAEAARLAAERAEFARQQEAAKPKPAPALRPTDSELAEAVAFAFNVDTATADAWLIDYRHV